MLYLTRKVRWVIILGILVAAPLTLWVLYDQFWSVCSTCSYTVENAFPNLQFDQPVGIYNAHDDSNRLFVIGQKGIIHSFNNSPDSTDKSIFLDIQSKVTSGGELGLLGMAFHPFFTTNGYVYLDYTAASPLRTVISRWKVNDSNPNVLNSSSEYVLLTINQPFANHNGGQLAFGPEGYLYIGMGDGGSGGDPLGNAQNKSSLLGKILRLDVDSGTPYAIPADNPFKGNSLGYKEEIYAYGLRNPWRFSFDAVTGYCWAADVGQNAWEEIDLIENGKNYGWNILEGNHCYQTASCDNTGLAPPVQEYGHDMGESITGGFVYRGVDHAGLVGKYIYGDYVSGNIWALNYTSLQIENILLADTRLAITSFGLDENKELFIADHNGGIYRLKATQ